AEKEKRDKSSYRGGCGVAGKNRYEKLFIILIGIVLVAVYFYTLYIGQLFWGIVIDVLILRLYFLIRQEQRYFRELDLNEDEAGTPHDPGIKRRVRLANILIILFVFVLVIYSYFTFRFIWGVVVGLMV